MQSRLEGKTTQMEVTTLADVRFAYRYNNTQIAKVLNMARGTCQNAPDDMTIKVERDEHGTIVHLEAMKSF